MKKLNSKQNININFIKVISISYVVIYHIFATTGYSFSSNLLNSIISAGGFVGVSIFLIISGYGIYRHLSLKKETYLEFILGRWKKLSPHYYISLFFLLLLTPCAVYLSKEFLFNIISHLFYFHNLFYNYHGAINGVCWTLGTIFQFYLIAPFLKKLIDKYPIFTVLFCILLTIVVRIVTFLYLIPSFGGDSFYYFIYGNQLFTVLDTFILGMLLSKYSNNIVKKNTFLNWMQFIVALVILIILILIAVNYVNIWNGNTYSNNWKSVLIFPIMTLSLTTLIYTFNKIDIGNFKFIKYILNYSPYQYSFYIWHLVIIENLVKYSSFVVNLSQKNIFLTYIFLFLFTAFVSMIIDIIISNINFKECYLNFKIILSKYKTIIFLIFIFCLGWLVYKKTLLAIQNINNFNKDECLGSCLIYKNVEKFVDINENSTYIYFDEEETGYLYFYQLRYYLSPMKSIDHYNNYVYIINYANETDFLNYISNLNVDYVIVRKNKLLETYGYEIDEDNGSIFKINKNYHGIQDVLKEVA